MVLKHLVACENIFNLKFVIVNLFLVNIIFACLSLYEYNITSIHTYVTYFIKACVANLQKKGYC